MGGSESIDTVSQFTTSMIEAGDREAWFLIGNMKKNHLENPNDSKIGRDQNRLNNVNDFIGLMQSINLIGIGEDIERLNYGEYTEPETKMTNKQMKDIQITSDDFFLCKNRF